MAKSNDWLPGRRDDILAMAKNWIEILDEDGTAWNVPAAQKTALKDLILNADVALQAAKADRSPVTTFQCQKDFEALVEKMRFFKKHYFLVPPLTETDLIRLGFKPPDTTHTTTPAPINQVTAEMLPLGPALIQLRMEILGNLQADPHVADHGIKIFYKILEPGDDMPTAPDLFYHHGFTRRKRDNIVLNEAERGKKICFCFRLENAKGGKGPWGPIVWTIIP
jgi:hypothetical protein